MSDHVLPVRIYLFVFLSLLTLTALTVAVAFIDLGVFNNVAALGIAAIKATLVVLYFMHVRYSVRMIPLTAGAGLLWLGILFLLTLADYQSRGWLGVPGK